VITADHGNIEQLIDYDTGKAHTAHTTNPVPLVLVDDQRKHVLLKEGAARDVAPTILKLLDIAQPKEMTGSALFSDS
jgi:2,3-bisphosphoglycerate-independent phosphoglycerate mutase